MNEARKALIKMQTAPQQMQLGRFKKELATLADFLDGLVNLKIENNALHAQLLEAHERWGKMLGDMATPPASKPDQAQNQIIGKRANVIIVDDLDDSTRRAMRMSPRVNITIDPTKLPPEMVAKLRGEISTPRIPYGYKWDFSKYNALPNPFPKFIEFGWKIEDLILHGYLVPA